mmetsp:Transcript_25237/g.34127  ORF Transcript_25237/g.34127 Transcript_25237/m.34127 type:complete len:89 (-) Transcript_25237:621-887(-)
MWEWTGQPQEIDSSQACVGRPDYLIVLHNQGTTPVKSPEAIRDECFEATFLIQAATRLALQASPPLQPLLCVWLVTGAALSEGATPAK